jgi:ppGpp synthetase/RelA/SpoT-type nucleotidyltranferase
MDSTPEEMRDEFTRQQSTYKLFAGCVQRLIETLLESPSIVIHSISHRVKQPQSLFEKLKRPGKNYLQLEDVTDLAGVRIITFLPEDVDKVAQIIESEFAIDRVNSIDKRLTNDPDRFGYASLHKVCSLNEQRLALAEYAAYRDLKCEVQIRTILQHAWAEIEHDLGYKSAAGVPIHFRRRFSRLAALLEAADEEFMRLKNDLSAYSEEIRVKVKNAAPGVPLDKVTLEIFIKTNELLGSLEATYCQKNKMELLPRTSSDDLELYVEHFKYLGVEHIDSLANVLERHKDHIAQGANRCEQVDYGPEICRGSFEYGWSLWMLIQLLCADKPTLGETIEAFNAIKLWIPDSLEAYAESLRAIVRSSAPSPDKITVNEYKSVYVTLVDEPGTGNSFPLTFVGDKWVWENVSVTDQHVIIDGEKYPIQSKVPLFASIVHKGKRFAITQ